MHNPIECLSVADAAQATGLSPDTLRREMRDGRLPYLKIRARRLIRRADLEAFIAGRTVKA